MADLKISQLSAATSLAGTEVVPVVQSGSTKKATIDQILAPAAGKGIDFSANGGDVLTQYDEGTWVPVFTSAAGTITSTSVNAATYTRVGRLVSLNFDATITNNGTGAVAINVTGLPFAAAAAYSSCGTLIEVAAVGFGGFVNQNSTTSLSLVTATWTYPGGTNYRLIGSVAYNV